MIGAPPHLRVEGQSVTVSGSWTLVALLPNLVQLQKELAALAAQKPIWNLTTIGRLDSAAAALIWRAWGRQWPQQLEISEETRHIMERAASVSEDMSPPAKASLSPLEALGGIILNSAHQTLDVIYLFGCLLLDIFYFVQHPGKIPWKEFSANIYKSGTRALPVTALVGFLIGVTISYLSALQLKVFGADAFIINILGISIIRELGPVLVAVLVAGRSGSAMTAQIGVMRVTEEIDALAVMGISRTQRIILPKVMALALVMPLLVLWISAAALIGGMLAANLQLGLSFSFLVESLPRAVPVANLYIGLSKGLAFGFIIALIACNFGLRVRPNTESLSANTTVSVVASITAVIVLDALFAIMTRNFGMPDL